MNVTRAPRGNFYFVRQGNLVVFDRDLDMAIRRLLAFIWPMPRPPFVEETVANVRTRPAHRSNTQ